MIQELIKAGLTRIEANVYLALLELGRALAGEISQKSGVHRRSVYEAINGLEKKDLVESETKQGNKYFIPKEPKMILDLLESKKAELLTIVPGLSARYEDSKDTQITNFFKGKAGLKTILDDEIIKGKEILVLGAIPIVDKYLDIYARYDKRRVEKNILMRLIFSEEDRGNHRDMPLAKVKYLPKEYDSPLMIETYANKVAIIHMAEKPFTISIKIPEITESYKNYFELLWKIAKK